MKFYLKVYANRNNLKFSKVHGLSFKVLDVVISPLASHAKSTLGIHKKLGKQKSNLNVDYLSQALELASER